MKHMKLSMKLLLGFSLMALIAVIVGGVGIAGMTKISKTNTNDFVQHTSLLPTISETSQTLMFLRMYMRDYFIYDESEWASIDKNIEYYKSKSESDIEVFSQSLTNEEDLSKIDEYVKNVDAYVGYVDEIKQELRDGNRQEAQNIFPEAVAHATAAQDISDYFLNNKIDTIEENAQESVTLTQRLLIAMVVVLVLGVITAINLGVYISGLVSKPLIPLAAFMKRAGDNGDLSIRPEDVEIIGRYSDNQDEIGTLINSANKFVIRLIEIEQKMNTIAAGDLTVEIGTLSDKDTLGSSIAQMVVQLNEMFSEINTASNQVNSGGMQVSGAAQALSQGATEQASAIEELSASIQEISDQVKENSANAKKANELVNETHDEVERGNKHMHDMLDAMNEINNSSNEISKIIKVIDDIAFQTNILALNAAVEAARAGSAGKGFAVVAEEVRNLASKSADAAKHTTELIEGSISSVEKGAGIAQDTAHSLGSVAEKTKGVRTLVNEITKASNEQAEGIRQINVGVEQISQVVQTNSATAEESAAASEELSGQANLLQEQVARIKLSGSGRGY